MVDCALESAYPAQEPVMRQSCQGSPSMEPPTSPRVAGPSPGPAFATP